MSTSIRFLVCILAVIPAVVMCKPSPQVAQPHPQVQPPVSGGPVPLIGAIKVDTSSPAPKLAVIHETSVSPNDKYYNSSPKSVGIHLEEVVSVHPDVDGPPCPKIFQPICGTDNKTYNSPCELTVAKRSDPSLQQLKSEAC